MPANELMKHVHNAGNNPHRMPAILRRDDHEAWLNGTAEQARETLRQYDAGLMVAYEVTGKVNSPRNNLPSNIEPLTPLH
jgi:putative SOS response-associated peptidase YedK